MALDNVLFFWLDLWLFRWYKIAFLPCKFQLHSLEKNGRQITKMVSYCAYHRYRIFISIFVFFSIFFLPHFCLLCRFGLHCYHPLQAITPVLSTVLAFCLCCFNFFAGLQIWILFWLSKLLSGYFLPKAFSKIRRRLGQG